MDAGSLALVIDKCRLHGVYAVSVCDKDGGTRMTPGKCCGQWSVVKRFVLTEHDWRSLARAADRAADLLAAKGKKSNA